MTDQPKTIWGRAKRLGYHAWRKVNGSARQDRKGSGYRLTWITQDLAVGYAPMFNDDLEAVRQRGITAIVNLCGEFCDLSEIQQDSGFDVCYLPIPDECAPDMAEIEAAIVWLDDALGQGKKVLVHCRFGVGRTGTFVTAYLVSKGMDLKTASKMLRKSPAQPSNHAQWKMLRAFAKKQNARKDRAPR